ncbi:cation efflux family protein [Podospora didyma]|uniref:Cation efflux family protein n=1 Tax=Podospora didyma TaxID=330526 RepID=A0AAE0P090_9PEZI|nr:cation efflux family protein [Podospora didyma]
MAPKLGFKFGPKERLTATIVISFAFFASELAVAFKTRSLALMADAFHYISERSESPQDLSFGWQRARLLGAFFNGVFLLALGISIFLQSIERFISLQHVEDPQLVLIMGCVGLTLNIISASIMAMIMVMEATATLTSTNLAMDMDMRMIMSTATNTNMPMPMAQSWNSMLATDLMLLPHAADQRSGLASSGRDLGMMGALIHVIGDALNNLGVIIAALVIWLTHSPSRFYADPGVSMGIAIMILLSALPLVKNSGAILLQSAPRGVDLGDVKHDLEKIPGIESVHELHVWRLDQKKAIASAHVVVSDQDIFNFMEKAKTVSECLHAYGIHSATLQPELLSAHQSAAAAATAASAERNTPIASSSSASAVRRRMAGSAAACQMVCGKGICEQLFCCKTVQI